MLSPLWLSLFSPGSPLSPPSSFSSLLNSVNLSGCSGLWRTLRELITGQIGLSPFDYTSSPPGHLHLPSPSSLLFVTLWTSLGVTDCGDHIGNLVTGYIALSPLDFPSSPPGHLYLPPPSFLLYVTPWNSLGDPGCGEHIGNWSLARLLSPLLMPSLLLLVTSISLLTLLFSSPCNTANLSGCGESFLK